MLFNSYSFFIFFPIVVLITFLIPKKWQYIWLLTASYFFYMNWDAGYVLLLLFSTVVTYLSGIAIEKKRRHPKGILVLSCLINLSILFVFKYYNFAFDGINYWLGKVGWQMPVPASNLLLPVGISFYTFQALSYTIDVYRGDISAERNFFKYALFVSFFPQLVAGPIERSKNLLHQINEPHSFSYENMRSGLTTMLWGYFLKLVIADRVSIVVDAIYGNLTQYSGVYFIIASLLFTVQIYCDFAGYSTIAVGAAKVLGFDLMENFNSPYFAESIKDFWRRWHISLSSWFRDYLYIPLGGSRVPAWKKYRNILIVFMVSGLWHGAALHFVVWGLLHGIYQVIGGILQPVRKKLYQSFHVKENNLVLRCIKVILTFALVNLTWIFFRLDTFDEAIYVIQSIFQSNNWEILRDHSLYQLGLSHKSFFIGEVSILLLIIVDFCKKKGILLHEILLCQPLVIRWIYYYGMILFILLFGIWGVNYDAASFIYFQF